MAKQPSKKKKVLVYDPNRPGIHLDPRTHNYVDDNGVSYYMHNGRLFLSPHQQVYYNGQLYVVSDGKLRPVSPKRERVSTNQVRQESAVRDVQEDMDKVFHLPGFPDRATVIRYENDALTARTNYNQMRYSYVQEDAISLDTHSRTEGMYEGICRHRLAAEMKVYTTVVKAQELFNHFKANTIKNIQLKRQRGLATSQDEEVLRLLQGKNAPTSFYEFSVRIGATKPLSRPTNSMGSSDDTGDTAEQIYRLGIERMNASFAMHYYMDQIGTDGLPSVDLSAYNSTRAYKRVDAEMAKKSTVLGGKDAYYDYFETVYPVVQESEGEAAAFSHLFQCMQSSPRWQEVAALQETKVAPTDQAARAAWGYLTPPVELPAYYGDPLDQKMQRFGNALQGVDPKSGNSTLCETHAASIRAYYSSNVQLEKAVAAMADYQNAMAGHVPAGQRIPYHETGSTISGVESSLGADRYAQNSLGGSARAEQALGAETAVIRSGSDVGMGVAGLFMLTEFVPGMVVFGGAAYGIHKALEEVREGRIQNGVDHLKAINREIHQDVIAHRTRLNELNRHPATKQALIYTRDQLQKKATLTPAEEKMLSYLNGEIENPEATTFGDVQFDDSIFNVSNPHLKDEVSKMSENYRQLVQYQNEVAVYSYAMQMYQNAHTSRQSSAEFENISNAYQNAQAQSRNALHGVNPDHFNHENMPSDWERGGSLTPTKNDATIAAQVDTVMRSYEAVLKGDPFKPIPKGARHYITPVRDELYQIPQQLEHRYQAMRALTRPWTNKDDPSYEKVPLTIATSFATPSGEEPALFAAYSFDLLRNEKLRAYDVRVQKGEILTEAEEKEIEILRAATSFASYQKACGEKGIDGVLTASHREKPQSTEGKAGWAVSGYQQAEKGLQTLHKMAAEHYEFLQSVHHYAQSGNVLKGWTISRGVLTLFPDRTKRLQDAKNHSPELQTQLHQEFIAERDVLSDMFQVLQTAPDFKAICAQNNWLDDKGNVDLSKIYSAPAKGNTPEEKVMVEADELEERTCRLIRAMENYRHEQRKKEQEALKNRPPQEEERPEATSAQEERPEDTSVQETPAREERGHPVSFADDGVEVYGQEASASSSNPQNDDASLSPESDEPALSPRQEIESLLQSRAATNPRYQAQIIKKLNENPEFIYQRSNPRKEEKAILTLAVEGGLKEIVSYVFDKAQSDGKKIPKPILTEAIKTAIQKGDKEMLTLLAKEVGPRWREVEMDVYNMLVQKKDPELVKALAPLLKNEKAGRTPESALKKMGQTPVASATPADRGALATLDESAANITASKEKPMQGAQKSRGDA